MFSGGFKGKMSARSSQKSGNTEEIINKHIRKAMTAQKKPIARIRKDNYINEGGAMQPQVKPELVE